MSFLHSLTASLDDVVFEGRNQVYGAYQLRQDYRQHLAKAGGTTLGLGVLLWLAALAWPAPRPQVALASYTTVDPILIEDKTVIEKPRVAPATPARARAAATHAPVPPTPTEVAPDNAPQPIVASQPAVQPPVDGPAGLVTSATIGLADAGPATGPDGGPTTTDGPANESSTPYVVVEKMPEFAGGQAALLRYLSQHLRYPAQALRDQTEGKVFMTFVVKADGTIADVTIVRGLSRETDEEALRVVRQMPAWTPGYQSKHPVAVRFNLPITFKIQ